MEPGELVEAVKRLEPGETGSWPAPTCKQTFPFGEPQTLQAFLSNCRRPILDVEVYHKPNGGGYVAHVRMLNIENP